MKQYKVKVGFTIDERRRGAKVKRFLSGTVLASEPMEAYFIICEEIKSMGGYWQDSLKESTVEEIKGA